MDELIEALEARDDVKKFTKEIIDGEQKRIEIWLDADGMARVLQPEKISQVSERGVRERLREEALLVRETSLQGRLAKATVTQQLKKLHSTGDTFEYTVSGDPEDWP
jgi:hypothetical protein